MKIWMNGIFGAILAGSLWTCFLANNCDHDTRDINRSGDLNTDGTICLGGCHTGSDCNPSTCQKVHVASFLRMHNNGCVSLGLFISDAI